MPRTDLHFKYLLAAGMQDNFSLREIVFVDPAEEVVRTRARELLAAREIENNRVRFVHRRIEGLVGERVQSVDGRFIPVKPWGLEGVLAQGQPA